MILRAKEDTTLQFKYIKIFYNAVHIRNHTVKFDM